MRLVSYGAARAEAPGVLVRDGARILPLRLLAADLGLAPPLARRGTLRDFLPHLETIARHVDAATSRHRERLVPTASVRLGAPVANPPNLFVVAANNPTHLRATGGFAEALPTMPMVSVMPVSSLSGPTDPVIRPRETRALDYEVELAVVIGVGGRRIDAEDAHRHVAGYMIANDVTARDLGEGSRTAGSLDVGAGERLFPHALPFGAMVQVQRATGCDTFLPTGPWLVTPDEAGPWEELRLRLWVNGELRQDGCARELGRGPHELIAWVSAVTTLRPGDVIATGTPGGVGGELDPPRWLGPGDVIRAQLSAARGPEVAGATAGEADLGVMETPVADEVPHA